MSADDADRIPDDEPKPAATRHRRLPLVLISVATLLGFLAVFAIWANRQFLNTDNWTDTSSELLENDEVRGQVALFLVDEVYKNYDVKGEIAAALPPRAAPLAAPLAGGLRQAAERGANRLLATPQAQELWENSNRRAHTVFLKVIEDEGNATSTTDGNVVLDLKTLLGETQARFGIGGRLQKKLPESAAQIKIMESDDLGFVQDVIGAVKGLAVLLLLLTLGLYALAIYLARGWRREALRAVGIGFIVFGASALVVRSLTGDALVNALTDNEPVRPAVEATLTISTSLLQEAASAALAYGVVMVLAAWLAGPTAAAIATRRGLAPYLREPRYAYGALAVIVLVVLVWSPTPATRTVLGALLLIALLAAGLEVLRRQTAREYPDASIEDSSARIRAAFRRRGAAGGGGTRLEDLKRLGELRDAGVLDAAEFEREKTRLLGHTPAGAS